MQISIENMTTNEKFLILEKLWDNLTKDATNKNFTPKWHLQVLEDREKIAQNKDAFSSLSSVQTRLEKLLKWI